MAGLAKAAWSDLGSNVEAALPRRGTQVVRERSAKPLCAGSIPARASNTPFNLLLLNELD